MRFDKWLKWGWIAAVIFTVLATIGLLLTIFGGFILPMKSGSGSIIATLLPIAVLVLLIPGVIASFAVWIMSLLEVVTSGKSTTSKVLWVIGFFIFGWFATLLYYFIGRGKEVV